VCLPACDGERIALTSLEDWPRRISPRGEILDGLTLAQCVSDVLTPRLNTFREIRFGVAAAVGRHHFEVRKVLEFAVNLRQEALQRGTTSGSKHSATLHLGFGLRCPILHTSMVATEARVAGPTARHRSNT
jgi:hypothetical protein